MRITPHRLLNLRHLQVASTVMAIIALTLVSVAAAHAKTYVTKGSYPEKVVYRPSALIAGSGVGGGVIDLKHIRWSSWHNRTATGRGTLTYNTCTPMCASGNTKSVRATVRLSAPRIHCELPTSDGDLIASAVALFTHITVTSVGNPPWRSITADTQNCQ